MQPKISIRKQIIKIKAKKNEIEIRKTIEKINKNKRCLFEKINKTDKFLSRLRKNKKELK